VARTPWPVVLGRGVIVSAGQPAPAAWGHAPRVTVDEAVLAEPQACVARLHEAWARRQPVVVEVAVDPARFREPRSHRAEPWTVGPRFEPWLDRLHFLVWANNYDARGGAPLWWWGRKAARLGATETPDGAADVVLADGCPAWIDGGPRGPTALPSEMPAAAVVHAESVDLGRLVRQRPPVAPAADLARDQLAAVTHGAGPARVIAPAGSGKTRVLTERLRHLIVDRGYEAEAVLAVAYNKKAQQELEERTAGFRPRVQTLNSLGYELLRRARGSAPRVVEEREVRRIVEDLVPSQRRRVNTDPLGPYLEALSLARLGLRDPAEVEDERDDVPGLAAAFRPYREQLAGMGAVDYDDQVYAAIEVLLADGAFRAAEQRRCRHLLIDEFQDLTPAHVLLLRLLALPALDVFGVGDDDQVIYGHAGADPAFLVDFSCLFPAAADHPLEVNYRCPVAVVDAARHLLSYNARRVAKEIRPGPAADASADALQVLLHPPEGGASSLVALVRRWLDDGAASPAELAVLTRVNSLLLAPHVALVEAGIPVDSVLRPDVLARTGVRAALAYLRIGADPEHVDRADLTEVYRRPSRGFPQWLPKWFRGRMSLDGLLAVAGKLDDEKVSGRLVELVDDLRLVADAVREGTTRTALAVVKDRIGLGGAMGLLDSSRAGDGGSSHLDDLEALEQVAALHPDAATFEPWLRGVLQRETATGGVTLSTVHRVKGREWDRVAVFGVTAGLLPHRLALDEEEERRVLHVAITRGRRRVAVLADSSRPSPFLAELDGSAPHHRAVAPTVPALPLPGAGAAPRRPRAVAPTSELTGDAHRAEAALRAWRLERARQDKVPAYVVLPDRYLRGIAEAQPRTLAALRRLPGIGPTKLELYGEDILAIVESVAGGDGAGEPGA
jgi:DNA helicase-2/ATP-dependent DNA helicase PcrA